MTKGMGMGWERDLPDWRDLHAGSGEVAAILKGAASLKAAIKATPASADLRSWCSPVENQESLGSCTANAGVGLLEYFERRAFGTYLDGSRLFLYKVTRRLLGWEGDQGATIRSTMQAMVMFGIPPERDWPYAIDQFDREPDAYCYALAGNYKTLKYYRLDPPGAATEDTLRAAKRHLAAGFPAMFGFTVYSSMPSIGCGESDIPFPTVADRRLGGHAVMAVGYDDSRVIGAETGALRIRNSWGPDWGDQGYGWLPYSFVRQGLAVDFWTLAGARYVDTGLFK